MEPCNLSSAYNGVGDRLSQTVGAATTHYVLDPGAGLTQVLADGTNTYLYGNDRLAQYQADMQYFGADGLGSVRQIFDASAVVVGSSRYDPFGNAMNQSGVTSVFAFAGDQQDAATGLTYLRARYYSSAQGRFMTRDVWAGDPNAPMSYNAWNYADGNPVNRVDRSGRFSDELIVRSLAQEGKTVQEVFGKDQWQYPRWGLYAPLKEANNWDRIYPATMPKSGYGLVDRGTRGRPTRWLDNVLVLSEMGSFDVAENGCELEFMSHDASPRFKGPYSLPQFVDALNGSVWWNLDPLVWWRSATYANHWYKLNGEYYSDFGDNYVLPDFKAYSATVRTVTGITVSHVYDRYGNEYLTYGWVPAGELPIGLEYTEGYALGGRHDAATLKEIASPPNIFHMSGMPPISVTWNTIYETGLTLDVNTPSRVHWYGYGLSDPGLSYNLTLSGNYLGQDAQNAWDWLEDRVHRGTKP